MRSAATRLQEHLVLKTRHTLDEPGLTSIATLSAGGDRMLGTLLARATSAVGWDGDVWILRRETA